MITLIYADASYDAKRQVAGLGVVISRHAHFENTKIKRYKRLVQSNDSNLAELQAVYLATLQLTEKDNNIIIMTDNTNVRQTIRRPTREEYAGDRCELGLLIRKELEKYPDRKFRVYHVEGHSLSTDQHSVNQQICDKIANDVRKGR